MLLGLIGGEFFIQSPTSIIALPHVTDYVFSQLVGLRQNLAILG
jgi:hypothetical protein